MLVACLFFLTILLFTCQCTATRIYRISLHPEIICGPSRITGTFTLSYTHDSPPVTVFSEDKTSRWAGPPLEIVLEPDDRQGEFCVLDMKGRHIPEGIEIENDLFSMCVKQSADINIKVVKGKVKSVLLSRD